MYLIREVTKGAEEKRKMKQEGTSRTDGRARERIVREHMIYIHLREYIRFDWASMSIPAVTDVRTGLTT
jgi:hypothetical protein